jgi:hypothetical protein
MNDSSTAALCIKKKEKTAGPAQSLLALLGKTGGLKSAR